MVRPAPSEFDEETIPVPRSVRFPVELVPPQGFDPVRLETWPWVAGRLEWVGGRLLYMPPCARLQWVTVADLVTTLGTWGRSHPEFEVGTNEAGMALTGAVRAADAAIWRRTELGADSPVALSDLQSAFASIDKNTSTPTSQVLTFGRYRNMAQVAFAAEVQVEDPAARVEP